MLNSVKDAVAARAALLYLNGRIARYGRLDDLRIDSRAVTIEAACLLHGETAPVTIRIGRYTIEEKDGRRFIRVGACSCTRPWLQSLMEDFVQDRPFELPAWAAAAL
jgi:hypothetical protein